MSAGLVDNELKVMQEVVGLLEMLDGDERRRVVRWFSERYGVSNFKSIRQAQDGYQMSNIKQNLNLKFQNPKQIHVEDSNMQLESDLLSRLQDKRVRTEGERVWVAMVWLRETEGREDFTAYEVNQELKRVGMKVGNITSAFSELVKRGLVVQVDKKGRFKQGRKKYRINIK